MTRLILSLLVLLLAPSGGAAQTDAGGALTFPFVGDTLDREEEVYYRLLPPFLLDEGFDHALLRRRASGGIDVAAVFSRNGVPSDSAFSLAASPEDLLHIIEERQYGTRTPIRIRWGAVVTATFLYDDPISGEFIASLPEGFVIAPMGNVQDLELASDPKSWRLIPWGAASGIVIPGETYTDRGLLWGGLVGGIAGMIIISSDREGRGVKTNELTFPGTSADVLRGFVVGVCAGVAAGAITGRLLSTDDRMFSAGQFPPPHEFDDIARFPEPVPPIIRRLAASK